MRWFTDLQKGIWWNLKPPMAQTNHVSGSRASARRLHRLCQESEEVGKLALSGSGRTAFLSGKHSLLPLGFWMVWGVTVNYSCKVMHPFLLAIER